ncbi:MAG: hypothetical protein FE78DRAFT_26399 [Acidomyces sp. 'richmondensis']|nr:MAG: hypothetical protein FE78DRAFT_26399 [Acidomyces sp. 'richmondensis']
MPSVPARARGQAQRHVQNAAACPPVRPTIFSVFSYSPAPDCCGLASLGRLDGHPLHTHSPSTCLYVLAPSRVARAAALRRALLASRVPVRDRSKRLASRRLLPRCAIAEIRLTAGESLSEERARRAQSRVRPPTREQQADVSPPLRLHHAASFPGAAAWNLRRSRAPLLLQLRYTTLQLGASFGSAS